MLVVFKADSYYLEFLKDKTEGGLVQSIEEFLQQQRPQPSKTTCQLCLSDRKKQIKVAKGQLIQFVPRELVREIRKEWKCMPKNSDAKKR